MTGPFDGPRFCAECGHPVAPETPFCGSCGHRSAPASVPAAEVAPANVPAEPAPADPWRRPPRTPRGEGVVPAKQAQPMRRPRPARRWVRRSAGWLRASWWPGLVVGVLLAGLALGYLLARPTTVEQVEVLDPATLVVDEGEAEMPALVGMDLDPARLALGDAGIDASRVELIRRGAAGAPGRVLAQDPGPSLGVQGTIYLTVSEPIRTPDLRGLDFQEATARVEDLGGAVRLTQRIEPLARTGSVLATRPAPGRTMTSVVQLTVADPGTPVPLSALDTAETDSCGSVGEVSVAGQVFSSGISCSVLDRAVSYAEFSTAGVAKTFTAHVGFDDDSDGGSASVQVLVDGAVVGPPHSLDPTQPLDLRVPVDGASLVRIEVRGKVRGFDYAEVVFGDAAFSVLPDDVDFLSPGDL